MDLFFQSASELSGIFKSLGIGLDVSQLSAGSLNGRFQLTGNAVLPLISIKTDQMLVCQGDRRPGFLPFSINTRGDHPLVRGEEVSPLSIHGFQSSLKDSYFLLQPGCEIQVAMVCKQRLQRLAIATNEQRALDRINSVNSAAVTPEQFQRLVELTKPQLHDPIQAELIEAELLELLSDRRLSQLNGGDLSHRAGLMKDLIAWGQENPRQVISLEDLTTTIFASRSSIVHSCRASFGMGPMALLKQIRLGQVQAVLLNPQRRESLGLSTVQAVATHFGFSSRNHFARDYRQLFGEAPRETLQRSATPGIRSHPVSVAHRPQMAMARR